MPEQRPTAEERAKWTGGDIVEEASKDTDGIAVEVPTLIDLIDARIAAERRAAFGDAAEWHGRQAEQCSSYRSELKDQRMPELDYREACEQCRTEEGAHRASATHFRALADGEGE